MLHMSANSNFTYAVHILSFLASGQTPFSSAVIADSINTNPVTVRRLIGVLREAGLVETVAGSTGGALLKRPAADITLGHVYEALQDKHEYLFGLHPSEPNPQCPIGRNIQKILVQHFEALDGVVKRALMRVTIQDIVDEVMMAEAG
jgi:Rrf2 family protein